MIKTNGKCYKLLAFLYWINFIQNHQWKTKILWTLWNHYNPLTDYSTATVVIDWVKNYKFLLQSRLGLFLYKESLSHIMALQWIMKHFIKSHCHCPWSGNRFSMLFFKRTSLAQHWISFYTILFWKSKISRCDIEFVLLWHILVIVWK